MTWKPVAELSELKATGRLCASVEGIKLLLIWDSNQVYALENRCSHAFKPLDQGKVSAGTIQCPYHGATFSLETGQHLSPPAFQGIRTFTTRLNQDQIEVDLQNIQS